MRVQELFIASIFVFAFTSCVFPQSKVELTKSEKSEAIRLAYRFSKGLEHSKDISPLISSLFAPDFISKYRRKCPDEKLLYALPSEVAAKATRKELRNFYIATANLQYLYLAYVFSDTRVDLEDEDDDFLAGLPSDVREILERVFAEIAKNGGIRSIQQMREIIKLERQANKLLRRTLTNANAITSNSFRSRLKEQAEMYRYFEPELIDLYSGCKTTIKKSHVIWIKTSLFSLFLERTNGRLQIAWAQVYIE
jgi:hypothetical protein